MSRTRWMVRGAQVAVVAALVAVAVRVHRSSAAQGEGFSFAVSVLGETLGTDGRAHAVDLLAHPGQSAERYQVAVTPTRSARVVVEESSGGVTRRLSAGDALTLTAGKAAVLPRPGAFFDRRGPVRLEVTVVPEGDENPVSVASELGPPGVESLALSDGSTHVVRAQLFQAPHGGKVVLELR